MTPQAEERARIKAITTATEAKGREGLASHLAFETDMTATAAKAVLAQSPVAAVAPIVDRLDIVMRAIGNPQVGANIDPDHARGGGGSEEEQALAIASAAVASYLGKEGAR